MIHHIAQFCHCLAQKNIGSGFDVAAAIYGSQVYQRFSPNRLSTLIEENQEGIIQFTSKTFDSLKSFDWDHEFCSIHLPIGTHLILGDVHNNTSSPTMASAVLKWKQMCPIEGNYICVLSSPRF